MHKPLYCLLIECQIIQTNKPWTNTNLHWMKTKIQKTFGPKSEPHWKFFDFFFLIQYIYLFFMNVFKLETTSFRSKNMFVVCKFQFYNISHKKPRFIFWQLGPALVNVNKCRWNFLRKSFTLTFSLKLSLNIWILCLDFSQHGLMIMVPNLLENLVCNKTFLNINLNWNKNVIFQVIFG